MTTKLIKIKTGSKKSNKDRTKGNTSILNSKKPNRNLPKKYVAAKTGPMEGSRSVNNILQLQRIAIDRGKPELSECAAKYASAIANPWSPSASNACIPYGESRMSQKVTSFARFDAAVGTAGFGFALFTPTVCNDFATVYYSNANFTGTTATVVATGTGVVSTVGVNVGTMSNLPYGFANLANTSVATAGGTGTRGRIVSYGVSASYTGTELNLGGLMYCLTDPNHQNLQGSSIAGLGSRTETDVSNVSRDKCWLMASAIDVDELDYSGQTSNVSDALLSYYPFSRGAFLDGASATGTFQNGAAPLVIMFTGTVGNTVHIEIIQHSEYIGPNTEGKTSSSVLDAEGTMKVLSAANRVPIMKVGHPGTPYGRLFYKALEYTGKELLPVAVSALKAMLV